MQRFVLIFLLSIFVVNHVKADEFNGINNRFTTIINSIKKCETKAVNFCKKESNPEKCWEDIGENCYKEQIQEDRNEYSFLVKEKKDKILLKIANGNDILLKNCSFEDCKWQAVSYKLITFIPEINYYVVQVNLNERERIIFINQKNGSKFYFNYCNFYKEPSVKFSKDYKRFACLNVSDAYRGSGLSIAIIKDEHLLQEYNATVSYWSKSVEWIDNKTLKYNYSEPKKGTRELVEKFKILKYRNGKWIESGKNK